MGVSALITIGISFVLSAAASAYAFLMAGKQETNTLSPADLDSFGITQAKEGSVVPLIYGRVRVPGNIIYYGNLTCEEITSEPEGGKGIGGSGGEQVTGYKYKLDIWQTVGLGKLTLIATYVNDEPKTPEASVTLWNDGTTTVSPAAYLAGATKLPGVAHIFYGQLYLGDNVTNVPTIHFVIEKTLNTGLPFENLSNGSNPAAIIYDLCTVEAGMPSSKLDYASFAAAATYYNSVGYGLNLVFAEQKNLYDRVNTVLQQVGGTFFENTSGKHALQAQDPSQATVATIATEDFHDFSLQRLSYAQLPNFMRATFKDEAMDYSVRMAGPFVNNAAIQIAGRVIEKPFKLEGFRDLDTANKRLAEIAKYMSYPVASIDYSTNFKFADLAPGGVVETNYAPLGIVSAKFRIDSVDFPGVDSLLLNFKATQLAGSLFDFNYSAFGGSEWVRDPAIPGDYPEHRSEIILPYNPQTFEVPTRLFLVERENDYEVGYSVRARGGQEPTLPYTAGSDSAGGYWTADTLGSFAKLVNVSVPTDYVVDPTLYPNYPEIFDHTYTLDSQAEGITLYTFLKHLDLTQWADLSRVELFTRNRFLFISTFFTDGSAEKAKWTHESPELIAFQNIELIANPASGPFVSTDYHFYKITNFMRAALYTNKEVHKYQLQGGVPRVPKESWLFSINNNIIKESKCGNYRVILPRTSHNQASEADNHPFFPPSETFAVTQKNVFDPGNICGGGRIHATRSGSTVVVKYYPATYTNEIGAGKGNPDEVVDSVIFNFPGTLYFEHGSTIVEKVSPNVDYSFVDAGAVTLKVYQVLPGRAGNAVYGELSIGTIDGVYIEYTERV